ncbi:GTP pyrophosphokinase [Belnapia arida]|uniref:GTP pyrophosphokinase n=1 Tax=Belnapia arida TaxID=2804533 RepID=UPI001F18DA3C|nr:hypothetical protein [Belnapia arida]
MVDDFRAARSRYEKLEQALKPLLTNLALHNNISLLPIESRVKEIESFSEKIARPDKVGKYNCVEDITDLCGLRIVTYSIADCHKMICAIRSNFIVDENNSVDKSITHDVDRFGYQSIHLVVSISEERSKLFEFQNLSRLKAEIQVRTVLQHAWASLDWKLRYKSEIEAPIEIRRKLYRVSALLEAADDTFSDLLRITSDLRKNYALDVEAGHLEIAINKDSLKEFIEKSESFKNILKECEKRGLEISFGSFESPGPWDYLIIFLLRCGISTLKQLETSFKSLQDRDFDALVGIKNLAGKTIRHFGVFSPIRILIISRMPKKERAKYLRSVQSSNPTNIAIKKYFESEQGKE